MFKKYKAWYRYSPKRDESDLDYGAGKPRKGKRKRALPSLAPSRPASPPGLVAPSRPSSPPQPLLPTAAKSAPEMVGAAAMDQDLQDEMKEMEMSQHQPMGEFPPELQYRFYLAAGGRSDPPPIPWGRFCVFISAGLTAVTLATILMSLYVATVLTMPPDEEETYAATEDGGGGGRSSGTVFPVYREKSTPRTGHLPESLRKARADLQEN